MTHSQKALAVQIYVATIKDQGTIYWLNAARPKLKK